MRDINRIDKFCGRLAELWKNVPDWRFGQLMYNFLVEEGDPFHWEEEEFIKRLHNFILRNEVDGYMSKLGIDKKFKLESNILTEESLEYIKTANCYVQAPSYDIKFLPNSNYYPFGESYAVEDRQSGYVRVLPPSEVIEYVNNRYKEEGN